MTARASMSACASGKPGADCSSRMRYLPGLAIALGVHATLLFGWQRAASVSNEQVEFGVEFADSSVEVSLVAALPAEETADAPETPSEPDRPSEPEPSPVPPPSEPAVEPAPEPLPETPPVVAKQPEMTLPEPAPAPPPPQPREKSKPMPAPPKAQPKQKTAARVAAASGDGSSPTPGRDATTAAASAGAASAKPGYLRNPHPAYPEEARKAGQQGVVSLRVSVDANGRPASVQVARSSGFPLLDERARSTVAGQWVFKPARINGNAVASQIIVPVRFTIDR